MMRPRRLLFLSAALWLSSRPLGLPLEASISGTVITDGDPASPVRRAVVTVSGPALRTSRSGLSDDEGRFRIDGLPPGSYTVVAARPGFITSAYGALRPARLGIPILVGPDAAIAGITIRLWRGAALAGTVHNEHGQPVEGLTVRAVPVKPNAAQFLSLTNNPTATDQDGRFRIFGLEPGQYFVVVTPMQAVMQPSLVYRDEQVDALLQHLRSGAAGGPGRATTPTVTGRAVVYSPVYFPGTTRPQDAVPITLTPGEAVEGIAMALVQVLAATVSGTVLMPDGTPASGAEVRLSPQMLRGTGPSNDVRYAAITGPSGSFSIGHVPSGTYDVTARLRANRGPQTPGGSMATLWAVTRLDRHGAEPFTGLVLQLGPGLTVDGTVRIPGTGTVLPAEFQEVRVALVAATTPVPLTLRGSPTPPVTREGTFQISDLRPDATYRLLIDGLPDGWWPDTALGAGLDLLDGPVAFPSDRSRWTVAIALSDRPTRLTGTLSGRQQPGSVFVVVFPADRTQWSSERRTRAVQPDAAGAFEFINLPPGDYLVGAMGDVDPNDWRDPAFLERVAQVAVPVTLATGETRQLHLTVK